MQKTSRAALLLVCILALPPAAHAEKKPDLAKIVAKVVDAYGGAEAMRAKQGYHASGEQWATQSEEPIKVERWFGRPDRLRLELAYPDHHETRITSGDLGWSGDSIESIAPSNPFKLQAMRLQTARLDLPLRLLEQQGEIEWRGKDHDGRAVLRLPIDKDLSVDYYVDTKTYRITRIVMTMSGPPAMDFSADYDDFKKVDGVLVPFKEITYAGNTVTSEYHTTAFEWNPVHLDAELQPGSRAFD